MGGHASYAQGCHIQKGVRVILHAPTSFSALWTLACTSPAASCILQAHAELPAEDHGVYLPHPPSLPAPNWTKEVPAQSKGYVSSNSWQNELMVRILEHEAMWTIHGDGAGIRGEQAPKSSEQCGLAASIRPQQNVERALRYFQGCPLEHLKTWSWTISP